MARRLLAIVFGVLLGLLLVEAGCRAYVRFALTKEDRDRLVLPYEQLPYLPHPYVNWVNRPSCVARDGELHNSQGFRGPERSISKAKDVFRIACLGGSTTYTQRVKEAETYPARLEAYLLDKAPGKKVEVLNAGVKGYTTAESLLNLLFVVLDHAPDAIVVYHAVNDFYPRCYPRFRPDYLHCRSVWVGEDLKKNAFLALAESTAFFPLARSRLTDYTKRGALYYWIYDPLQTQGSREFGLKNSTTEGFEMNLAAICRIAKLRGIQCVIVSQAQNLVSDFSDKPSPEPIDQMNAAAAKVAAAEGALFVDAAKDFPQTEGYFDKNDIVHMQALGARELAQRVGDGMLAAKVLDRPAPRAFMEWDAPSALKDLPRLESPLPAASRARIENGEIVHPSPYFGYALVPGAGATEGLGPHDEYGRRTAAIPAADPKRERRIVVLGGSSTYGVGVSAEDSMPAQLQRLVRARGMNNMVVMNCGVPGYTTAEMLAAAHFRDLRVGAQIVVIDYDFEDAVPRTLPGYRTDYAHARKTFRFGSPTFPASLVTTTLTRGFDPLGSGAPLLALRDGETPSLRDSRVTRPGPFATYRNLRSLVDLARATPGVERVILVRAVAPNGEPGFVAVAHDWNDAAKQIAKETRASVVDPGELTGCCVPGSYLPNREGNARRADAVLKAIRGE